MTHRLVAIAIATVTLFPLAASCTGKRRGPVLDTSPPATQPADALIVYHRTGGTVGVDEWIVITDDGRMKVSGPLFTDFEAALPEGTLPKLEQRFASWDALDAAYPPPRGTADAFVVQIRYRGKIVTAALVDESEPPGFVRARLAVEGLAAALEPRESGPKPAPRR